MKIIDKHAPFFRKIYNDWYDSQTQYRQNFVFWLKNKYHLDITSTDNIYYWEDEDLIFESEEDYFLCIIRLL